jgi:hypothetical protein
MATVRGARVRVRLTAVLACAVLAAGACDDASAKVQPLPPLKRPSPEQRAGLPEVRGIWRFAGFEIRPQDTLLVREQAYQLTPPDEMRIITQRLDSIAGQLVRGGVGFPFAGEVRRDGTLSLVSFTGGIGQFAAGRIVRDTFWIELTTLPAAQGWPPAARAAMVRGVPQAPFRRLLGGAPINPPVDSARLRDSIRMDSLRRAGVVVPPGAQPGVAPPVTQPGAVPPGVPPAGQPQRPPAQTQPQRPQPQRPTQPQRPPPTDTPVTEPEPEPPVNEPQLTPVPNPNAPRDTLRLGVPPG